MEIYGGKIMLKHRNHYDEEFKKNAVKLSYASPKTVREIAEDLCKYNLNL